MAKIKIFFSKNIKKKRFWIIGGVVLIVLASIILSPSKSAKNTTTDIVKMSDLKETVLATGQVISNTDLELFFRSSGTVKDIKVKTGDKVKKGDLIASLDGDDEKASLTTARGVLLAAQARYKRVVEGASNEEINLSRVALENAKIDLENTKRSQETVVQNAYHNLLNSTPEAVPEEGDEDFDAPIISGSYTLGKEGLIKIRMYNSSGGTSYEVGGLTSGTGSSNTIIAQPIGKSGLFIKFPEGWEMSVKEWVIEIPNKKASNYLTNLNAYQTALRSRDSAISSAQSAVAQRQAEYDLKIAGARNVDVEMANAEVLQAEGSYQQALARYNDTLITAPVDGTITSIDTKIGELATPTKRAFLLEDVTNMYVEAYINEANISTLTSGMPVDITFDAFGTDKIWNGYVTFIDPSSNLISGVVNYKIKASIPLVEGLKPGMTANMTIKVKEKAGVLIIPTRSIITDKSGDKTVRLITNSKNKKWKEVKIETGMEGDGGMTEVISGLSDGDEIVILIKK